MPLEFKTVDGSLQILDGDKVVLDEAAIAEKKTLAA